MDYLNDLKPVGNVAKQSNSNILRDLRNVEKTTTKNTSTNLSILREAIAEQESRGSGGYSAYNKTGDALGRYQIVPKWNFDKIGLKDTAADRKKFLNTPALQDQLFEKIIDDNVKRYGSTEKGVAAYYGGGLGAENYGTKDGDMQGKYLWDSEKNKWDTSKPTGYPSINEYVNSIMGKVNPKKVTTPNITPVDYKAEDYFNEEVAKTVKGLPGAVGDFIKGFFQSTTSFPVSIMNEVLGDYKYSSKESLLGKAQRFVFGEREDEAIGGVYKESAQERGLAKDLKLPEEVGTVAFVGIGALDYVSGGGASKVVKDIVKATKASDALKIAKEIGVTGDAVKPFVKAAINVKTEKEAKELLKITETFQKKVVTTTAKKGEELLQSSSKLITTTKTEPIIDIASKYEKSVPMELKPLYDEAARASTSSDFIDSNIQAVKTLGFSDAEAKNILRDMYRLKQVEKADVATFGKDIAKPSRIAKFEKRVGVTPTSKSVVVKDSIALKKQLKELESATRVAKKVGVAEGIAKEGARGAAKMEKAKGVISGLRASRDAAREMQKSVTKFMNKHLPKSLRGGHVVAIKNATTPNSYKKAMNRLITAAREYNALKQASKVLATKRSKLSFINRAAKLSPAAMREVKIAIGLVDKNGNLKNIKFATDEQLNMAIDMMKQRYEFVKSEGLLKFKPSDKMIEAGQLDYSAYAAAHKEGKKINIVKKISDAYKSIGKSINDFIRPVTSSVAKIDESVKVALKRLDFQEGLTVRASAKVIKPFAEKFNKLNIDTKGAFKGAVVNGDFKTAGDIMKANGMEAEWKQVNKWLEEMFDRAKRAGLDIEKRDNYFPRVVKDKIALADFLESSGVIDKWIKAKEAKLGRKLTPTERADIINKGMRGFGNSGNAIYLPKTRIEKERVIDIIEPEMLKFYDDPIESLAKYNETLNRTIAVNNFFGKGGVKLLDDGNINWQETIGGLLSSKKLTAEKQKELQSLLSARFNYMPTIGIARSAKNIVYGTQMNSLLSAITQLSDIVSSIYANGAMDTVRGIMAKNKIKLEDVGLDKISAELESGGLSNRLIDLQFRINGISAMDRLGKEVFLNAAAQKYVRDAKIFLKTGKENTSIKELRGILGSGTDDYIKKLASGGVDGMKNSEDGLFVLYNKLSRLQPVSLSEMPKAYLEHPNLRFFYALKTWTLKTVDFIREESIEKIIKGETKVEKAKGVMSLFALVTMYTAAGMGTDQIKNMLQGKQDNVPDMAMNNLLKIFSFNQYMLDSFVAKGPVGALTAAYIPGASSLDDVAKDVVQANKDMESGVGADWTDYRTVKYVPIIGRLMYSKMGKGSEEKKGSTSRSRSNRRGEGKAFR